MTVKGESGRQRRWHEGNLVAGLCAACGKERDATSVRFCAYHMEYARQASRLKRQRRSAEKMVPLSGRPRIARHVGPRYRASYGIANLIAEDELT